MCTVFGEKVWPIVLHIYLIIRGLSSSEGHDKGLDIKIHAFGQGGSGFDFKNPFLCIYIRPVLKIKQCF